MAKRIRMHYEQRDDGEIYFFAVSGFPSVGGVRKLIYGMKLILLDIRTIKNSKEILLDGFRSVPLGPLSLPERLKQTNTESRSHLTNSLFDVGFKKDFHLHCVTKAYNSDGVMELSKDNA
ncbi:hypothetical protein Tco_0581815 [Tanacetum coccineum]